ncbi:MAG: carbamoyltransferase N-terminal domain-containing protein [bacterium]
MNHKPNILGISCHYHDSAACLMMNGRVVAAAQEERFNRRKNTPDFPINALNYCLQAGAITVNDLDYVVFYEKPFLKLSRVIMGHLMSWPASFGSFLNSMPVWLTDRLSLPLAFRDKTGYSGEIFFIKHHLSHAASAFLVSSFEEAAIMTADAVGEWTTAATGFGKANAVTLDRELVFPDSLGLLYTAVTTFLGFEAHEGEGKVMGLAGLGKPSFSGVFSEMAEVSGDGSFRLNPRFFNFYGRDRMYTAEFSGVFGPCRRPEDNIEERHCDVAASLQKFTEDVLVKIAAGLHARTGSPNLCLAGGVFLNCVANQKILEKTGFKNIFIQPAAGDSGGALGAAAYAHHCILDNPRVSVLEDAFLGPEFSGKHIERALANSGTAFRLMPDEELFHHVAVAISENKVVGWFQGRMEFGPRALGNRSILGNPCNPGMKKLLNDKVKHREPFRPYAPAVLEESAKDYFEMLNPSPFMLLAPRVREEKKKVIPAACHDDGTARVQSVGKKTNPRFWNLIKEFEKIAGVPLVLNTSFNRRGEPIVCVPEEALKVYLESAMDCLVLGNYVLEKPCKGV